jgi:hypothetical protein
MGFTNSSALGVTLNMVNETGALGALPTIPGGSMPDLSFLLNEGDYEAFARIVFALLEGATWKRELEDCTIWGDWVLLSPYRVALGAMWRAGTDEVYFRAYQGFPNPFTDPAAAWELETRELRGWCVNDEEEHRYDCRGEDGLVYMGPWHVDRKNSAVLAVLDKHRYGPLQHLIEPLLDKMMEGENDAKC